jgi:hypothetical protein
MHTNKESISKMCMPRSSITAYFHFLLCRIDTFRVKKNYKLHIMEISVIILFVSIKYFILSHSLSIIVAFSFNSVIPCQLKYINMQLKYL